MLATPAGTCAAGAVGCASRVVAEDAFAASEAVAFAAASAVGGMVVEAEPWIAGGGIAVIATAWWTASTHQVAGRDPEKAKTSMMTT